MGERLNVCELQSDMKQLENVQNKMLPPCADTLHQASRI